MVKLFEPLERFDATIQNMHQMPDTWQQSLKYCYRNVCSLHTAGTYSRSNNFYT